MNKASKIKMWILLFHFIALFTPIYTTSLFGARVTANVSELNAGPFFVIAFAAILVWNFVVLRYKRDMLKYTQFGTLGAMGLLIALLWIGTDSNTDVGVSMTYQVVFTALYACMIFLENQTVHMFGKLDELRLKALHSLDEKFGVDEAPEFTTDPHTDEYEIID